MRPGPDLSPDISVVIPAWRAEATVARAIRSALAQTGVRLEVLVVDDASPDGTARVVAQMAGADPRVRLLRQPRNGGAGAARNAAIAAARGRWLALQDADDAMAPGRLAALLAVAKAERAEMVADNLRLVGSDGVIGGTAFPADLMRRHRHLTAASFVRSNLFLRYGYTLGYLKPLIAMDLVRRTGGFPTDLPVAEDFHFYLDCLLAGGRWLLLAEASYLYTVTPGSLSRSLSLSDMAAIERASAAALAKAKGLGRDDVVQALRQRHRSIRLMIGHMRFVDALKQGRAGHALREAMRRPGILPYVVKFGVEGVRRRLRQRQRILPA